MEKSLTLLAVSPAWSTPFSRVLGNFGDSQRPYPVRKAESLASSVSCHVCAFAFPYFPPSSLWVLSSPFYFHVLQQEGLLARQQSDRPVLLSRGWVHPPSWGDLPGTPRQASPEAAVQWYWRTWTSDHQHRAGGPSATDPLRLLSAHWALHRAVPLLQLRWVPDCKLIVCVCLPNLMALSTWGSVPGVRKGKPARLVFIWIPFP